MKTATKGCEETKPDARERNCLPCDIPPFCRNSYYKGKLLTERDFIEEQSYHTNKLRLHTLALHGWGIVCGLRVTPHPHCPELRVIVEPGFAIDTCGREIRVLEPCQVPLPKEPEKAKDKPCDDDDDNGPGRRPPKPQDQAEQHHPHQEQELEGPHHGKPPEDDPRQPSYPPKDDGCGDGPAPVNLYLCIRYKECETEFRPAPFDDCGCNNSGEKPNRICEGYEIVLMEEKPDWWDKLQDEPCSTPSCEDLFRQALECPTPPPVPCLPLAVIRHFVPGEEVTAKQIDNWAPRPKLMSAQLLYRVIRCILDKLPTKDPTRITDINWQHGQTIRCARFISDFVGTDKNPEAFRVEFDSPVYSAAIDDQTFQAIVIYEAGESCEPRRMEVAPAVVDKDDGETEWCSLRIDPVYARKYLDGRDFDLFLVLRCNVITGRCGLAVDGNFLATQPSGEPWDMAMPTGDGIPGGTFESWVRVVSRRGGQAG